MKIRSLRDHYVILYLSKDKGGLEGSDQLGHKPQFYYAFEMLYWTGIRCGELLALTADDIDVEKRRLRINKSYQRIKGKDLITEPKTRKSNRTIIMPDFLAEEMDDYIKGLRSLSVNALTLLGNIQVQRISFKILDSV